jgi:hypothetical protein
MSDSLAAIKKLYFSTSKATISRDFDDAIDLLKTMATDEERERAAVFMDGLAQMKAQWQPKSARAFGAPQSAKARGRSGRSTGGGRRTRSGD